MDDIYFPDELWLNRELEFTSPSPSTWKVTEKVSEEAWILTKEDTEVYQTTSWAAALFTCHNDTAQEGFVEVYMQLPYKGPLVLPADMRRQQASDKLCEGIQSAINSYKRLNEANCDFIPKFIGYSHEKQDHGALVPGGFLSYWAYMKVPGIALGNGLISSGDDSDIPGVIASQSLSEKKEDWKHKRIIPDGIFWKMPLEQRAKIRAKFDIIYRKLVNTQVSVHIPGLKNLYWNDTTENLYIIGHFEPISEANICRARDLSVWGLALPLRGHNWEIPAENDHDLMEAGWIL